MAKRIQQRSLDTQARILSVTRALFDDLGEKNVTTDMIAHHANVAKGTVFAHFTDRQNLVAAVAAQELKQVIAGARADVEAQPRAGLTGRIMLAYRPLLGFFAQKPEFAELFIRHSTYSESKWSACFVASCLKLEEILGDILRAEHAGGSGFSRAEAELLLGGMQAFFLQIVTYRMAGWIRDDDHGEQRLLQYLARWLPDG